MIKGESDASEEKFAMLVRVTFVLDFIFSFFTVIPGNGAKPEISDRKKIAVNYLGGWFFIDFLTIIPFDTILTALLPQTVKFNYGNIAKMARLFRLIRIIKMLKLSQILKSISCLKAWISKNLRVSEAIEKLLTAGGIFLSLMHFISCTWIYLANSEYDEDQGSWLWNRDSEFRTQQEIYLMGAYFSVTTMTTVGYGDIYAETNEERLLACFSMVIGVLVFSYTTGTIASILESFDDSNSETTKYLETLSEMRKQYKLPGKIYRESYNYIES
jgi:hypothetical protein